MSADGGGIQAAQDKERAREVWTGCQGRHALDGTGTGQDFHGRQSGPLKELESLEEQGWWKGGSEEKVV